MGQVYSKATLVLIWIGEGDEASDYAFDMMLNPVEHNLTRVKATLFNSLVSSIMSKEWFDRLWTVQELVLADADPLVGCGFKWIPWSFLWKSWDRVATREFSNAGLGVSTSTNDPQEIRPTSLKLDRLNDLRATFNVKDGSELRSLLLDTNLQQATEPRDWIYGLMGMMKKGDRRLIEVDYARPC